MPNAFPSLHMATALVLVLFAPGKFWQAVSLVFLGGTVLATLSTGEHYVIDLVAGFAFGCFAACVGYRRFRSAIVYLAVVPRWTLTVRFGYPVLTAHPCLLRFMAALTIGLAVHAVFKSGSFQPALQLNRIEKPCDRRRITGISRFRHSRPAWRFSSGTNSSVSPGWVCVPRMVPAGSSRTECAERQADSRHGPTALLTFLILFLRSR